MKHENLAKKFEDFATPFEEIQVGDKVVVFDGKCGTIHTIGCVAKSDGKVIVADDYSISGCSNFVHKIAEKPSIMIEGEKHYIYSGADADEVEVGAVGYLANNRAVLPRGDEVTITEVFDDSSSTRFSYDGREWHSLFACKSPKVVKSNPVDVKIAELEKKLEELKSLRNNE